MKTLFHLCLFFLLAISLKAQVYNLSGTLSGSNEVPPVLTLATGEISGTFNESTGILEITVVFNSLSAPALASHIHNAPAGVNGGVVFPLIIPNSNNGMINQQLVLTPLQSAELLAGNYYVNIHTPNNPGGEIRSQIFATLAPPIPALGTWAVIVLSLVMAIAGVLNLSVHFKAGIQVR